MLKARVAEWILSLVTRPDRAEATVGDLLEDRTSRGDLRFWISIGETALSLLWRDFTADWRHCIKLATLALLVESLALVAMIITVGLGSGFLFGVLYPVASAWMASPIASWIFTTVFLAGFAPIDFQTGRWLARRSPGQEIAVCCALMIFEQILTTLVDIAAHKGWSEFLLGLTLWQIPALLYHAPLFVGAVLIRRRRLNNGNIAS
jgi:hypothetical protein